MILSLTYKVVTTAQRYLISLSLLSRLVLKVETPSSSSIILSLLSSLTYKVVTTAQRYLISLSLLSRLVLKVETPSSSSIILSRLSSYSLKSLTAHFVMHLFAFGINFLPYSVNLILIILFLMLLTPVV